MFLEKIKKNIWCFWDKIKRNAVFYIKITQKLHLDRWGWRWRIYQKWIKQIAG